MPAPGLLREVYPNFDSLHPEGHTAEPETLELNTEA